MTGAEAAAGIERFPEGRVEWTRPYWGWFLVVCIITSLLCAALYLTPDIHSLESGNETAVNITASGFLSISTDILEDGNTVRVIGNSSGPVDAVVKAGDGGNLFEYRGLMPGEHFDFVYQEPCTVSVSAI